MARIRSIKPEFFTSLKIGALTVQQRLTFIGLWTYVDDDGIGIDDARLVRAAVWPLDDRPLADVEEDLERIAALGLIQRYAVEGVRYLAVTNWREHQKISHARPKGYPPPPFRNDSGTIPEDSGMTPPLRGRGREEDRKRIGKEEEEERANGGTVREPTDGRTDRPVEELSIEEQADEVIRAANRGMVQNPEIGDRCHPIPLGHSSRQIVLDLLAEVPVGVVLEVVEERARTWKRQGNRAQITTMKYFEAAVKDAWELAREQEKLNGRGARPVGKARPKAQRAGAEDKYPAERASPG